MTLSESIQRLITTRPGMEQRISVRAWAVRAGVRPHDVVDAVGAIRDAWSFTDPETGKKVSLITLFGQAGGYVFTRNPVLIERGRRQMLKRALTTIARVWKGIVSPYLEQIRDRHPQLVDQTQTSYDRLIEDTERVLALASPNGTP